MTQAGLLLKTQARNPRERIVLQTDQIRPRYMRVYRVTGSTDVGGVRIQHTESTGKLDRNTFEIINVRNHGFRFKATAAAVKSVVRRLRPQEAAALDRLDTRIEAARQILRELGAERSALLCEAFERGHVVTLAEVRAAVEQDAPLVGRIDE